MEPEQVKAEILRMLHRLCVIDYNELDKACDELTIRMFKRQLRRKDG